MKCDKCGHYFPMNGVCLSCKDPDVKAKQREYMREYFQRPAVKAKNREYMREYMRKYDKRKREATKV